MYYNVKMSVQHAYTCPAGIEKLSKYKNLSEYKRIAWYKCTNKKKDKYSTDMLYNNFN